MSFSEASQKLLLTLCWMASRRCPQKVQTGRLELLVYKTSLYAVKFTEDEASEMFEMFHITLGHFDGTACMCSAYQAGCCSRAFIGLPRKVGEKILSEIFIGQLLCNMSRPFGSDCRMDDAQWEIRSPNVFLLRFLVFEDSGISRAVLENICREACSWNSSKIFGTGKFPEEALRMVALWRALWGLLWENPLWGFMRSSSNSPRPKWQRNAQRSNKFKFAFKLRYWWANDSRLVVLNVKSCFVHIVGFRSSTAFLLRGSN